MKIVFLGTPEFAVATLDAIRQAGHEIAAVVTMPDKPAGRGLQTQYSAVKNYALEHQFLILQPENLKAPDFIAQLSALQAELFVIVAFRMLPEIVFTMPPKGTFNIHASLLPNYRGAAPIQRAIMNGETKSGVTAFFLNKGMDTGDIIEATEVVIHEADNAGDLYERLMMEGGKLAVKTIAAIENGTITVTRQPQIDPAQLKTAPKILKEDMHVNWDRPACKIYNQIRGLAPYPAAFTVLKNTQKESFNFKIFKARICPEKATLQAGSIEIEMHRNIKIHAKDFKIELLEVQFQGKKRMACRDFLQGFNFENFTEIAF
ncbi:MAG: methionyl-tRNA formyltransferase [Bacteroidales bacterium]|nr:methionyl-tRNA formyltransferase [Bacteroidales bacterium]